MTVAAAMNVTKGTTNFNQDKLADGQTETTRKGMRWIAKLFEWSLAQIGGSGYRLANW
jgi:hypothetical protein